MPGTHFYRLFSLVVDIGSKVLQDIIEECYQKDGISSLESLLNDNKHNFFHIWQPGYSCCTCSFRRTNRKPALFDNQWNKYYSRIYGPIPHLSTNICPCCWIAQPDVHVYDLDITMCCIVIRIIYLHKLDSNQKEALEYLQKERNKLAHDKDSDINETFEKRWSDLKNAIEKLLECIPNKQQWFKTNMERLKTKDLDPDESNRLVIGMTELFHRHLKHEDLLQAQEDLMKKQNKIIENQEKLKVGQYDLKKQLETIHRAVISEESFKQGRSNEEILSQIIEEIVSGNGECSTARNISKYAVGIDLGTTFTCVAVMQHGKVEIIANDIGRRLTPSCVAFTNKHVLIGSSAETYGVTDPQNYVFDTKRIVGRRFDDPVLQSDAEHWPFSIVDDNNNPKIKLRHKGKDLCLLPEDISAIILAKAKRIAGAFLDGVVNDAVITIPASFSISQRQATKAAAMKAGLNVLRIINEPTAAVLAYKLEGKPSVARQIIIVYDLGGGTFDVSIVCCSDEKFEVLATRGDPHLGGKNFDDRLIELCKDELIKKHGPGIQLDIKAMNRLRIACEGAKRSLSVTTVAKIEVESIIDGKDFVMTLSRARFEEINMHHFRNTIQIVEEALSDSNLAKSEIDDIILAGGSTRIPKIRSLIQEYFDREIKSEINPDEVVAHGAALRAASLSEDTTDTIEFMLSDVMPMSLGIENTNGTMNVIVKRNTVIPIKATEIVVRQSNVPDGTISIKVFEGEKVLTKDDNFLGELKLSDLGKTFPEQITIEVTFEVDSNGMLSVLAMEKSTGSQSKAYLDTDKGMHLKENSRKRKILNGTDLLFQVLHTYIETQFCISFE